MTDLNAPYRFRLGNFLPKNLSSSSLLARSSHVRRFVPLERGEPKDEAPVSR